jgi:hypothetical protein
MNLELKRKSNSAKSYARACVHEQSKLAEGLEVYVVLAGQIVFALLIATRGSVVDNCRCYNGLLVDEEQISLLKMSFSPWRSF